MRVCMHACMYGIYSDICGRGDVDTYGRLFLKV